MQIPRTTGAKAMIGSEAASSSSLGVLAGPFGDGAVVLP